MKDQLLTLFWTHNLTHDERDKVFKHLEVIEKELREEEIKFEKEREGKESVHRKVSTC